MNSNPNKPQYGILKYGGREVAVHKTEFIAYKTSDLPMGASMDTLPLKTVGEYVLERKPVSNLEQSLEDIRVMSSVEVGTHTFTLGEETEPRIPNGEIYVVVKEGSEGMLEGVIDTYFLKKVKNTASGVVVSVSSLSPNPVKVALSLQDLDYIEIAEPDFIEEVNPHSFNWDGKYISQQWAFENKGGGQGLFPNPVYFKKGADCKGFAALRWIEENNIPLEDGVEVGVIDDAIAEFEGINLQSTFSCRTQKPDASPRLGVDKHGTAVCSTIAANNDMLGVSPDAPIHFIGFWVLSDDIIEQQFKRMEKAHVVAVCCSWGASSNNYVLSTRKKEALKSCTLNGRQGKGTLICFASGNAALKQIAGFAADKHTLAIGACTSKDELSHYSNTSNDNPEGEGEIFCVASSSIVPNLSCNVPGWFDEAQKIPNGYDGIVLGDGEIETRFTNGFGGTSNAAPKVVGAIHLCARINPQLTADELKAIISQSCDLIGGAKEKTPEFGHGKLNVLKAVKLAYATTQEEEEEEEDNNNNEDKDKEDNIPTLNVQELIAYAQGVGQISTSNKEEGAIHFWNSMVSGNYIVVITDINGEAFNNPDFDVYMKRIGDAGMNFREVQSYKALPTKEDYDYAGTGTGEQEVLMLKDIKGGTYAFRVHSKDHDGPYKLTVRTY